MEKRCNSGIGAVSQILSILNRVSLGHFYYEMALVFRDTMLVSKLVSSSEAWYNITDEQYSKLEEIDELADGAWAAYQRERSLAIPRPRCSARLSRCA